MAENNNINRENIFLKNLNRIIRALVFIVFNALVLFVFPYHLFQQAPDDAVVNANAGLLDMRRELGTDTNRVYRLEGEWEFYPNQLYTYDDFAGGEVEEPRMVSFPHYWKNEPEDIMPVVGYATYRMQVQLPEGTTDIGIYSRYQYSAYEIYLDENLICQGGDVSPDFNRYIPSFLPSNGVLQNAEAFSRPTVSVIVHIQSDIHIKAGLGMPISIGSARSVTELRNVLMLVNGLITGGWVVLAIYFLLGFLRGRGRREYLDYALVSVCCMFFSLTTGGEALLYNVVTINPIIDAVFLMRLEYFTLVAGAFCANYQLLRKYLYEKRKKTFIALHFAVLGVLVFHMTMPPIFVTRFVVVNMILASSIFLVPLFIAILESLRLRNVISFLSVVSFASIFVGVFVYTTGINPWSSIDLMSLCIMLHCMLQMIVFFQRYNQVEYNLKNMAETLEERIVERTVELTLMKDKAEAATLAKSNFLASMSHEIRTPMNAIIGMSDLMRTDNLDVVQQRYFADIKKTSKALLQIINDILDFSKIEAGRLEIVPVHFNLMTLYDNICSMSSFSANAKDLDFRHSFDESVPEVIYDDEVRYRQIITNVLNNAIKYTRRGFVELTVRLTQREGKDFLQFRVEDSGIGIKESDLPMLFQTFQQLDEKANHKIVGTGLGLAITKNLVTLMEGEIEVSSVYGEGSVFSIYLPLHPGDPSQVDHMDCIATIMAAPDVQVLVVDDNFINLTVAMGFLSTHGIEADTAAGGAEAIEKISQHPYDIVFMDHMMPEMDGVEATIRIRNLDMPWCADMPIVALTANAVSGARETFLAAGMNDFLSKPIESARLNAALAQWLPKEKILSTGISMPPKPSGQPENRVEESIFGELRLIDGLNVEDGMNHVGDNKDTYLHILRQYCTELDHFIGNIKAGLAADDWTLYTINIHSAKGIFANMGYRSLSEWSAELESAARNGDYARCREENSAICDAMYRFRDSLVMTGIMEVYQEETRTVVSQEILREDLSALRESCLFGDTRAVDEIAARLSTYSYTDDIDERLVAVKRTLDGFDYDIAIEIIDKVLSEL